MENYFQVIAMFIVLALASAWQYMLKFSPTEEEFKQRKNNAILNLMILVYLVAFIYNSYVFFQHENASNKDIYDLILSISLLFYSVLSKIISMHVNLFHKYIELNEKSYNALFENITKTTDNITKIIDLQEETNRIKKKLI